VTKMHCADAFSIECKGTYASIWPDRDRQGNYGECWQQCRAMTSGPGPGPNQTMAKLVVQVVNKPEPSTRVWCDGKLQSQLNSVGCQLVALPVHP